MNTKRLIAPTLLCIATALGMGCSRPARTSVPSPAARPYAIEMKDSSGKAIASGTLFLPSDVRSNAQFSGSCKIRVPEVPEKPSTQHDYAIRCLSQNNGVLSGRTNDGAIRIELHPQVDDNTIFLEGKLTKQLFKGKWYYQSYAGYKDFGTFEATIATKDAP